jgi:hypothetical protein
MARRGVEGARINRMRRPGPSRMPVDLPVSWPRRTEALKVQPSRLVAGNSHAVIRGRTALLRLIVREPTIPGRLSAPVGVLTVRHTKVGEPPGSTR